MEGAPIHKGLGVSFSIKIKAWYFTAVQLEQLQYIIIIVPEMGPTSVTNSFVCTLPLCTEKTSSFLFRVMWPSCK